MKKIIIFILLGISTLLAQEMKFRISESNFKQKNIEYSQGGILLRFNHQKLYRVNFDNKIKNYWQCKELWLPKNTRSEKVRTFIQYNLPTINMNNLNSIINNYQTKVKIDTTASWTKKDIVKKLLELEKRVKALERP